MRVVILVLAALLQVETANAQSSVLPLPKNNVGVSRLLTNDLIGDGKDRWRTGSYSLSFTFGEDVQEGLPSLPVRLMEYRLRAEVLAPAKLSVTSAFPDRPYAGVLGIGAFTHFET